MNRSPSFSTNGEELDQEIKHGVLTHAIRLLKLRPSQKTKAVSKTRAESQSRLMRGRRSVSTLSTDSDTSSPGRKPRTGSAGTSASGTDPAAPYDDPEKHKRIEADRTEYEDKHRGDYYRIYPTGNTERMTAYKELIGKSTEIFFHAGGTKVSSDWKKESTLLPASPLSSPAMARRRGSKGGGLPNLSSTGSPLANRRAMGGGVRAPGLAIGSGQPPGVGRKISADPLPAVDYEAFLAELDGMRIECPGKTRQQTEVGWPDSTVCLCAYFIFGYRSGAVCVIVRHGDRDPMCCVVELRLGAVTGLNRIHHHSGRWPHRTQRAQRANRRVASIPRSQRTFLQIPSAVCFCRWLIRSPIGACDPML